MITKNNIAVLAGIILLLTGSASYSRLPDPKADNPLKLFNHEKHHEYFSALATDCAICHKDDNSYTIDTVNKMGCHVCHNNPQSPSAKAKKFKCITCHKDLQKIMPENHELNWVSRHQTVAKEDKQDCMRCHEGYFCTQCHQQRSTLDQANHSRNYRFFHSIDARGNPQKCDKCHTVNFCKDCHSKR